MGGDRIGAWAGKDADVERKMGKQRLEVAIVLVGQGRCGGLREER